MNKLLGFLMILLLSSCVATAQPYKSHTVVKGETIESIAEAYKITPEDIIKLNPDARRGIRKNTILIIPSKSIKKPKDVEVTFTNHKVRRKETLFSISKKYGVSQEAILKYNEKVAKDGLKKGDRIAIPVFKSNADTTVADTNSANENNSKNNTNSNTEDTAFEMYTVKAKETKWGIAHSYGLTIEELEAMNPAIEDGLKMGQEIKLPKRSKKPKVASSEDFAFYTVKPKQTVYTLTRTLGVSEGELIHLNPALKDGLKAGMILKLPVEKTTTLKVVDAEIIDKFSFLENADTRNVSNIVLMLPFKLNEIDLDSVAKTKDQLRDDRILGYATEFYTGAVMALDSIKKLGFSVNVKVMDTEAKTSTTRRLIQKYDFSDVHAVIGPILPNNIEVAASELKSDGIPVISPLSSKEVNYRNVYQTIPSKALLEKKMLEFIEKHSENKNIIIIADKSRNAVKAKIKSVVPTASEIVPDKGNYIKPTDIQPLLQENIENWVILESEDLSLLANVTSVLNSYSTPTKKIVLLTTDKNDQYDKHNNIYNSHLSNLNFHYPSIDKPSSYDNAFNVRYEKKYKISPSRIATRGFDITFDILLRLAYDQNLAKSVRSGAETSYIENKFDYAKKIFGGFFNEGVFIVKYENLQIKEAE